MIFKKTAIAVVLLCLLQGSIHAAKISRTLLLMGSRFEIAAIHEDSLLAINAVNAAIAEIERVEALISSHKTNTFTHQINTFSGVKSVLVPSELYQLIKRSNKISELTSGAFDISYAVMDKLWQFKDGESHIPDKDSVAYYSQLINYHNIVLEPDTSVFLAKKGMKIGFGGIGKGYAANRAKLIMLKHGIESGYVDASGDILFWGTNENKESWKVGIASPENRNMIMGWLRITNMAVVTSGNYENFILTDSVRYSHILDPISGWATTKVKSVTVVCPDAELADALATAITVLGTEKGIQLIDKLNGVECLIIGSDNAVFVSANLKLNRVSSN